MMQDESRDLGESSQSMPQQLVKVSQILKGNLFLWKRFKTAWGGLTALAGINSSRKISLVLLVMSRNLSKLIALWPRELKDTFSIALSSWSSHYASDPVSYHSLFFSHPVNLQTHESALAPGSSLWLSLCHLPGEMLFSRYLQDFPCSWLVSVSKTPCYLLFLFSCFIFLHRNHHCSLILCVIYCIKGDSMPFSRTNLNAFYSVTSTYGFSLLFLCFYSTLLRHWALFPWSCSCSRYNRC